MLLCQAIPDVECSVLSLRETAGTGLDSWSLSSMKIRQDMISG
jgi:hypothetical protein